MPQVDPEHVMVTNVAKRALRAKESPMTLKRLLELIEEEKERSRGTKQASGESRATADQTKGPHRSPQSPKA